ncbi:BofC C-terminal domain-containing protein [Cohnella suwonensis]|uniref:BofC C-terminal domain-containing protein n=1 Tax=Cohnella suwonensis TaxID=696072 RepID=A0ABW0LUJ1_9BACL
MSRFRIWKELKKSLKRKRRHVWSLGAGAAVFLLAVLAGAWMARAFVGHALGRPSAPVGPAVMIAEPDEQTIADPAGSPRATVLGELSKRPGDVKLVLHRTYLCGDETRQLGRMTASEAAGLLKAHRNWEASLNEEGKLTVEEAVDDLSPACRQTSYMGIDKDGNLSLFDGPPWQEKVVRTFFQLDVDMMESRMSEERVRELSRGIRVSDKYEYDSVLSSLGEYAALRSQAAPQPSQ